MRPREFILNATIRMQVIQEYAVETKICRLSGRPARALKIRDVRRHSLVSAYQLMLVLTAGLSPKECCEPH